MGLKRQVKCYKAIKSKKINKYRGHKLTDFTFSVYYRYKKSFMEAMKQPTVAGTPVFGREKTGSVI